MLVLTRKHQEKIRIGDHIVITVLKTKGKTVRLGIEAPAEVPVLRGELNFEERTPAWDSTPEETDSEVPQPEIPTPGRAVPRAERIASWPVEPVRVALQRVPREQMRKTLPELAASGGPLRAMLERRSATA